MGIGPTLFLAATCGLDLVLLAWLLRPSAGPVTLRRCVGASLVTAGFSALKLPVALLVGPSLFYAVSIAYVDLVVAAPLAAAITLVRARAEACTAAARALLWIGAVAPGPVGLYASFVEPFRLVEEHVDVLLPAERAPREPLRVAVLADLQSREVDEHLRDALRRALAFDPHLIVLPGDLIQLEDRAAYLRAAEAFRELLRPLRAPLGVYFVLGNTDTPDLVRGVFEGTGVRVLENESVELAHAGARVVVGGAGFSPFAPHTRAFVKRLERRDADELRILVAHYPDTVLDLGPTPGLDLAIAGHTHGGQVQLPWFGPPVTLSQVPRAVAAGGLHELEGRRIYVSRGVGCERGLAPRLRFWCPPEVSLLTLRGP